MTPLAGWIPRHPCKVLELGSRPVIFPGLSRRVAKMLLVRFRYGLCFGRWFIPGVPDSRIGSQTDVTLFFFVILMEIGSNTMLRRKRHRKE